MSAEIVAKLGLNDSKFSAGLDSSERKMDGWLKRTKLKLANVNGRDSLGSGSSVDIALRAQARAAAAVPKIDPLPALPAVEQKATGILGLLRRKFSATDLFKDSLKSIGVGLGVGSIATVITEQFSHAADKAKALAGHTSDLYQTTLRLIGVAGGPTRDLQLQGRQVKELNRDIEEQRKLLASFTLLDQLRNPAMMLEQEQLLQSMIKQQADLAAGIDMTIIEENRRTEALQRQMQLAANMNASELRHGDEQEKLLIRIRGVVEEIAAAKKQGALPSTIQALNNEKQALKEQYAIAQRNHREKMDDLARAQKLNAETTQAELRNAGEVEKKQIRLNALRRDYSTLKERNAPEPEKEANRNEQRSLQNQITIDRKKAARDLSNTLAGVGADLAGRGPNGGPRARPRGRSERERLADRAAQFQLNAEEGVRTGKSPDYVARMASAAASDFRAVGGKMGQSTSQISKDAANALSSPLLKTNQLLEDIRKNLTPTKTK